MKGRVLSARMGGAAIAQSPSNGGVNKWLLRDVRTRKCGGGQPRGRSMLTASARTQAP